MTLNKFIKGTNFDKKKIVGKEKIKSPKKI